MSDIGQQKHGVHIFTKIRQLRCKFWGLIFYFWQTVLEKFCEKDRDGVM